MTIDARVMNFARKGSARNENDILRKFFKRFLGVLLAFQTPCFLLLIQVNV
ncbi:MAG: hypothetical protein ACI8RD_006296 [Bacillariaceae sp.]|jgi:hypothetical protein